MAQRVFTIYFRYFHASWIPRILRIRRTEQQHRSGSGFTRRDASIFIPYDLTRVKIRSVKWVRDLR